MAAFWNKWFSSQPTCRWKEGRPILSLLAEWDGSQPLDLAESSPATASGLRFASGALDGILSHHGAGLGRPSAAADGDTGNGDTSDGDTSGGDGSAGADIVESALFALGHLAKTDGDHPRAALYDLLLEGEAITHVDAILEALRKQQPVSAAELRPHARWLVREAAHVEPLKLGIALLGACGTEEDLPDLELLARHDELTLYAAVAAASLTPDPPGSVDVWWRMARQVSGWGKIHVVERLAERVAGRPDVQAWLLRQGCDNQVMPEYLAHACATGGRLAEALGHEPVDDALLDGACLIVRALLSGGPAPDIESYAEGALAVRRLLAHLTPRCGSLSRLDLVRSLYEWLEWPPTPTPPSPAALAAAAATAVGVGAAAATAWQPPRVTDGDSGSWFLDPTSEEREKLGQAQARLWPERAKLGWTEDVRAELWQACRAILDRPEWAERVRRGYTDADDDDAERDLAWRLAPAVGIDLWEDGFRLLAEAPRDQTLYYQLMHSGDADRRRRVVAFAEAHLPLSEIASGPDQQLGLGPGFFAHGCLDMVLQTMAEDPGLASDPLLAAALRSPVVRNRHFALTALEHQPPEHWGERTRAALQETAKHEVDDELRARVKALAGKLGR